MHFATVPFAVRLFSPRGLFWSLKCKTQEKSLYLTFDDGPVPEVTPQVLSILAQYNAKATFFCVGDNVRKHPEVFKAILDAGHAVGNHTYSHLNGSKTNESDWYADIEKCDALISSDLFRPPYGRISWKQVKNLRKKYKIIMWSVLTGDYNHNLTKEMVLDFALKYSNDGSIIVFHDSIKASERMLFALPKVIEHFTNKGYTFRSIKECL